MRQSGFTLLELLIALTISLFLLMLLGDAFFSLRTVIEERNELARSETQALQVMYYLNQYIPYAGFIGCVNVNSHVVVNHLATEQGVLTASSVLIKDKQFIAIKLIEHPILFTEPMINHSEIIVKQLGNLQKNDVVVVGDCGGADVDKIAAIRKIMYQSDYKITLAWPLSRAYQPYATIAVLHHYRYFLKPVNDDQQGSALFVADDKTTQELVANVYGLTFHYLPTPQQPKAVLVSFIIRNKRDSAWQFIIPLLERL